MFEAAMFEAAMFEAAMDRITSTHCVSFSRVTARPLLATLLSTAMLGSLSLGCGGGNGDPNLRPTVLTPTVRSATDVLQMQQMEPEVMVPQGPPPGVPDEEGYISGPPQECNGPNVATGVLGTPAPQDGLLLSFATYQATGTWGDASVGQVTGGTSLYSGVPADALTQSVVNAGLQMDATIAVGGYTGIVFWFGPCVNASAFSGIEFTASGSLSGANMLVKAQTSPDYPIDVTNTKGKCRFRVEANRFTECQQPQATVSWLGSGTITLPWASFSGGVPVPNVDPAQLLGFELQFQCPGSAMAACELDLNLGDVRFTP